MSKSKIEKNKEDIFSIKYQLYLKEERLKSIERHCLNGINHCNEKLSDKTVEGFEKGYFEGCKFEMQRILVYNFNYTEKQINEL